MLSFLTNALDLRRIEHHLIHSTVARRAARTDANSSFWIITDHDPVELHEYLNELGFIVHTFIVSPREFRVFCGKFC